MTELAKQAEEAANGELRLLRDQIEAKIRAQLDPMSATARMPEEGSASVRLPYEDWRELLTLLHGAVAWELGQSWP